MAESDSDSDLMWYLDKLSKGEFETFLDDIASESLKMGLPQIQRKCKEDLVDLLMTSYETQDVWNIMFNTFQKRNRKDLCEKITLRRNCSKETHRLLAKKKFTLRWEKYFPENTHTKFFTMLRTGMLITLDSIFESAKNVFIVGDQGMGKSITITWAVVQWTRNLIWKDRFSYIVFITSHEINHMGHSSLVDLISKDWPDGQAPVADILSDSREILFIVEDMDNIELDNTCDLCTDSREKVSPLLLLNSLLRKKLAPNASFLISGRPKDDKLEKLMSSLEKSIDIQLPDETNLYFNLFFQGAKRAETANKFVQDNEILTELYQAPILCWVMAVVLQNQMNQNIDMKLSLQTPTDIYAHFLAHSLTFKAGTSADNTKLSLLQSLCNLAAEGLCHQTLLFSEKDLRIVGITENDVSTLQALMILLPSNRCENHYIFSHLRVQEFCAALAYLMEMEQCEIPSANKTLRENWERYEDFTPVMISVCGLLNEKRRNILEKTFGCQMSTSELKEYFEKKMTFLGHHPKLMNHHMPVFYCLFENQEENFVNKVINSFGTATILITENKDMLISIYCLERCNTLWKLRMSVQHIFDFKKYAGMPLSISKLNSLKHWRNICSLLYTKEKLRELEISNSWFEETSERVLCKALNNSNCHIQKLKLTHLPQSFRYENIFDTIAQMQNLTFLGLTCITISLNIMSLIHKLWKNQLCHIKHLSLMWCELSAGVFEVIESLITREKLRKLSLTKIKMKKEEIEALARALASPQCSLKSLVMLHCFLNTATCHIISSALKDNRSLEHIDLSVNRIQIKGVFCLTVATMNPTCKLKEIELCGCFISTLDIPHYNWITEICKNLTSIELGTNDIGDVGMQYLCRALRTNTCKLENVGLEECRLTGACTNYLISTLIVNRTLKRLNLIGNSMGNRVIMHILKLLRDSKCSLQIIGLPIIKISTSILDLLNNVRVKRPKLQFLQKTWSNKEGREMDEIIEPRSPRSFSKCTKSEWDTISTNLPRRFLSTKAPHSFNIHLT